MSAILRRLAAIAVTMAPVAVQADLVSVTQDGALMVSDSTLNVTWADTVGTNLTWNTPFGPGTAQEWVASLNAENYGGYSDWVLPTGDGTYTTANAFGHPGLGASTSETENQLVYLFINELGNTSGDQVTNLGPFTTLSKNAVYWSGTPYAGVPGSAWVFSTYVGQENGNNDYGDLYNAIAVRAGAISPVPLPATCWLMLSGLGVVAASGRKRKILLRPYNLSR